MPIKINKTLPAEPAEKISTANVSNPVAGQVDSAGQKPSDHVGEPATNSVAGTVTKLALVQSSGSINASSKSGLNAGPVDADPVQAAIERLNKQYAVVPTGSSVVILRETVEPSSKERRSVLMGASGFRLWLKNQMVDGEPLSDLWL